MKPFVWTVALLLCLCLLCGVVACGSAKDTSAPSQVTGIVITTPCNSATASFAWDAASADSGVDHYLVAVDGGGVGGLWAILGNVTTYTLDTAPYSPGSHTFAVKAVDGAGNEGSEGSITFTIGSSAPVITGVAVSSITESSVTVTWTTSEDSTSQVEYGATIAYGSSSVLESSLATNHTVNLTGLSSETTYHYRVKSQDACTNEATSGDNNTFTTLAAEVLADTKPPVISSVMVTNITVSGATMTWQTDEPSTGEVEYGPTASYGSSRHELLPGLVTGHTVTLSGLSEGTTYHFTVISKDASHNEATSADQTFVASSTPPVGQLAVHFIDVGQGDAILLDSGEHEVLIDGGSGDYNVATYLSSYVDGPLEAIVATGMDADHIGGLPEVLNGFEVQQVWHNGTPGSTVTYAAFMTAVGRESADVHVARQGDTITVGSMAFSVLNPAEGGETGNNASIVLSLAWGQVDFLFAADAEAEAEGSMVGAGLVHDVDILKVGHHGSRTSSTQPFLAQAKPEVAIYMAGEGNGYGHPHAETIAALQDIGATTYGTDVHGTVTVSTDGATYQISPEKPAPPVTPDNTPPVISDVAVLNTTSASATVTWTTDEGSTSQVEYGPTTSYGSSTPLDASLVTTHSVSLSGLASGTTYHFRVVSGDAANNESVSQDGTFGTPTAGSAVQITYIFYDGAVSQVESDEYVEIKNLGDTAQDITGWVLKDISDEGFPSLKFPSYVLQPGASIRVYTNEVHPEWGGFSFRSGTAVWNNKNPDTAALFDAKGNEVSRKSY